MRSTLNYPEFIHRREAARLHIINHKRPAFLMVFPNGAAGPLWAGRVSEFAGDLKVCDNRGLRSKKREWRARVFERGSNPSVPAWSPKELS